MQRRTGAMEYERVPSLTRMFFAQAERLGERPCMWAKRKGAWQPVPWESAARQVLAAASGLRRIGIRPGDRILLVSENRPHWAIADLAVMVAGAVTVPAYTTNTVDDHLHLLRDSGAVAAIASGDDLLKSLLPAAARAPGCRTIVTFDPVACSAPDGLTMRHWDALEAPDGHRNVLDLVERSRRTDVACIIYTSGTGGRPKGVVLTHGSILCNIMGAYHLLAPAGLELDREIFLSFLPLSHSYEHTAGLYLPMSVGAEIYYGEGVEHLLSNFTEVRPTYMTAVPRLFEVMRQRILRHVHKQSALRRHLFDLALRLGTRRYEAPQGLSLGERLLDLAAERLVRQKIRDRFGGRIKALVSGGAPLSYDVGLFFTALGVPLCQGYGQTEASPVVSCNPPDRVKLHTVGPALRGVDIRIAEDGEILVRGELVMRGYWNDEEGTGRALRDGWLHTGDIGRVDGDGYIQITDRKKDIIVLTGGDNVSPAKVEGRLVMEPEIAQAMVFGDKRPHLVAVLVPESEFMRNWAVLTGRSPDLAKVALDPDLHGVLLAAVERANAGLSAVERVRHFIIAHEAFTVDNSMMTPTLKVRRHRVLESYGGALEALY
jgi:long-chain acyl-CoA synthetase